MAYASGKFALAISDRSGLQFPYTEMVKEWTGAWVHTSEYEPKAPQLMPHEHSPDPQALSRPRPARVAFPVPNLLPNNAFTTTVSTTVTVKEPLHKRSTNDYVRFRDVQRSVGGVTNSIFNLDTTLKSDLSKTQTGELFLTDSSAFPSTGYIVLDEDKTDANGNKLSETIYYTGNNGTDTLSGLTRGSSAPSYGVTPGGSPAVAHDSGAKVFGSYIITVINTTDPQGNTISNSYSFVLNSAATSADTAGGFPTFAGPVDSRA